MCHDGSISVADIDSDFLIDRIKKFRTKDLLYKVGRICNQIHDGFLPITRERVSRIGVTSKQQVLFVPWALAFIAKWSIIEGGEHRTPLASDDDLFELVGIYNNLPNPAPDDRDRDSRLLQWMARTSWEQFPYQDPLQPHLPRYFTLLKTLTDQDCGRVLDIPREWESSTGIALEDYMILGIAAYSKALQTPLFSKDVFETTPVDSIRSRATPENMAAFLHLCSADYERFRDESAELAIDAHLRRYEFNLLRKYPLIRPTPHELVSPIPNLILERITRGVYYEMKARFAQAGRNPFAEQFGRSFEAYVGFLLKEAYGDEAVHHEPRYGSSELRGPDWIVIDGETAVLLECTVTETSLEAKTVADIDRLTDDLKKIYVDRIRKYQRKIEDLKRGSTGLDMRHVSRFIPLIVTHESVYVEPVLRSLIASELERAGITWNDYRLVDICDVELVTGWRHERLAELLDGWENAYMTEPQSLGAFLGAKAGREHLRGNPFLKNTLHQFAEKQLGLTT
jgi:hypothetical protein